MKRLSALLLALVTVSIIGGLGYLAYSIYKQPINRVLFIGERQYLPESSLVTVVDDALKEMHYWSADLDDIALLVESVNWIESARVERASNNTFAIFIKEQKPIAQWNDIGYLNRFGEVYEAELVDELSVPILEGPEVLLEQLIREYRVFNESMRDEGMEIVRLHAASDGQRTILLNIDVQIRLGTYNIEGKILRFAVLWNTLSSVQRQNIKIIDMRYDNAAAISWHEE